MNTAQCALVTSLLVIVCSPTLSEAESPAPNSASSSHKTYRNPLLPDRILADPFVLRFNGQYYLYPTSDSRGYEVWVSDDLVNWQRKARAYRDPRGGCWAPEVFHNKRGDGMFYLYYTDDVPHATPAPMRKEIGVAVADDPLGPFADKGVLATNAIDADPFQNDDGSLYLYYVDLAAGFKIVVQPMANPLTKTGEPKLLIRPTDEWEKRSGEVTEGPFMLKHKGLYYLMYSGSGADSPNYGIGYATSKSPLGPFVKYAGNPIAHRGGNVLGPGHHCVIEGPDRKLWLVYHQKWTAEQSFRRFLAIDPLWFDDQGVIHTRLSRDTDEPAP